MMKLKMKFEDNAPFSALAFKVANDPFVGSLTFIRIYSGTVKIWNWNLQYFKR